jgi:hypothetical protein
MTNICYLLAASALLLSPSLALAGEANAQLSCVSTASKLGSVKLSGSIPGDFAEFSLVLTNKDGAITLDDSKATISVIEDFKNRVFTVSVTGKQHSLLLYALPKTILSKNDAENGLKVRFAGVLREAPKPGYQGSSAYESLLRDVPISCVYRYSI